MCFVGGVFSWGLLIGKGVGCVFVGGAMSDSGECVCWVGVRVGLG